MQRPDLDTADLHGPEFHTRGIITEAIRASRDILPGEEITRAYMVPNGDRGHGIGYDDLSVWPKLTKQHLGGEFKSCKCGLCLLKQEEVEQW